MKLLDAQLKEVTSKEFGCSRSRYLVRHTLYIICANIVWVGPAVGASSMFISVYCYLLSVFILFIHCLCCDRTLFGIYSALWVQLGWSSIVFFFIMYMTSIEVDSPRRLSFVSFRLHYKCPPSPLATQLAYLHKSECVYM